MRARPLFRLSPTLLVGAWLLFSPLGLAAAEAVPAAFPISRYQKIIEDSPFRKPTEATPTPPPAPKDPGFWENLYVSGIMTISGKNHVMLVQRSDSQRFLVATGEENAQGLSVVSIQFGSDGHRQTRVTVKKGAEVGVVTFDQNSAGAPTVAMPPRPGPAAPGGQPMVTLPPRAGATPPPFVPPGGRPRPLVMPPTPPPPRTGAVPAAPVARPPVQPSPKPAVGPAPGQSAR